MTLIKYTDKTLSPDSLAVVDQANDIIDEYAEQGFSLTLRQLYYQFVARDLIPNTMKDYKRLGRIVNDGRLLGMISWTAIEDRTRNLKSNPHWEDPAEIVHTCAKQFAVDKWEEQGVRFEVWIEKEALVGVIEPVCRELDIDFFACRGYNSQSEAWAAAQRMICYQNAGQHTIILHLGDHDPSGIDMTRDIFERMQTFIGYGQAPGINRIALNMEQVDQYGPPPNPAKVTDSRFDAYLAKFGEDSWELDALEPKVIEDLIRKEVEFNMDKKLWEKAVRREQEGRALLGRIADRIAEGDDFADERTE